MMRILETVLITIVLTSVVAVLVAVAKFGTFDVESHTDTYTTYCNDQLVSSSEKTVMDEVTFNVDFNESLTLFSNK